MKTKADAIISEDFGLYRVEIIKYQQPDEFWWHIHYLDEGGEVYGGEGDGQPYAQPHLALGAAMVRLVQLFSQDMEWLAGSVEETKAGNGTRTHDILLGNFSLMSTPSNEAVQE